MEELKLSQAIQMYQENCQEERKSQRTIDANTRYFNRLITFLGDIPVRDITRENIENYLKHEEQLPTQYGKLPSNQTLNKYFEIVRKLMRWLYQNQLILDPITPSMTPPQRTDNPKVALTDEQVGRIFAYLEGNGNRRDYAIFEMFIDTGCKLEEVTNINITDLNLADGFMKVPNSQEVFREVPLSPSLQRDLTRYISGHRQSSGDEKAVFTNDEGSRFTCRGIQIMVERSLEKVGIKGGPNLLRRTFSVNYLKYGGSVEALRQILGNKTYWGLV